MCLISRSNQKHAKGTMADTKPIKNIFNGHLRNWQTTNKNTKNTKNKIPCPIPTGRISIGLSNKYFIGIATKNSKQDDKHSIKASIRKACTAFIIQNLIFFIQHRIIIADFAKNRQNTTNCKQKNSQLLSLAISL